jgi:hypothetical protein
MGQWELHDLDGIVVVQSGIYWGLKRLGREPTDRERQEEYFDEKYWWYDGEWYKCNPHHQGYDRGNLTIDTIVNAWNNPPFSGELKIPSTRFVTTSIALASYELWPYWRTWRTITRHISLLPIGKRMIPGLTNRFNPGKNVEQAHLNDNLVATRAYIPYDIRERNLPSHPYIFKWDSDDPYETLDDIDGGIVLREVLESEM